MIFPPEFRILFRQPETHAAFVSDIASNHPGDCNNCGGMGKVFVFIAVAGPLNSPPLGEAVHFADGKWWGGSTKGGICPTCRGTGKDPAYVEKPWVRPVEVIEAAIKRVAEAHS